MLKKNKENLEFNLFDFFLYLSSKILLILIFVLIIISIVYFYFSQKEDVYQSSIIFSSEDTISDYNNLNSELILETQNITNEWVRKTLVREISNTFETIVNNEALKYLGESDKKYLSNSYKISEIDAKKNNSKESSINYKLRFVSSVSKNKSKKIIDDIMSIATKKTKSKLFNKINNSLLEVENQILSFDETTKLIQEENNEKVEQDLIRVSETIRGEFTIKKKILEENIIIAKEMNIVEARMDLLQPFLFLQSSSVNFMSDRENLTDNEMFFSYIKEDFPLYFLGQKILKLELDRVTNHLLENDINSKKRVRLLSMKNNPNIELSGDEIELLSDILNIKLGLNKINMRLQETLNSDNVKISNYQSNAIIHEKLGINIINLLIIFAFLGFLLAFIFYYVKFIGLIRNN